MDLSALKAEIKDGLKTLENLDNIVTIFGGARVSCESKAYQSIMKLAQKLGAKGYSIMTGGRSWDYGSSESRADTIQKNSKFDVP